MDSDINPNWLPLEQQIGERCEEWMWMYRRRGLEYYKHRYTRQYLILDSDGTVCWHERSDGELVQSDFETEYRRATYGYSTEHN